MASLKALLLSSSRPIRKPKLLLMPITDKSLKAETWELTSQVESPEVPEVIRVGSKRVLEVDPVEETANPLPFLSVILVLRPSKATLRDSSLNAVPLRQWELPWVMMEELKVLPMLSLRPLKLPKKLLSLMEQPLMTDNLDLICLNQVAVAVIEVASEEVAVVIEVALEAASVEIEVASEVASVAIEADSEVDVEAAEAASEVVSLMKLKLPTRVTSFPLRTNPSSFERLPLIKYEAS